MKIGFTGTKKGMTKLQRAFVLRAIGILSPKEVHHGGCCGADEDFHKLALFLKLPVHVHFGCNKLGYSPSRMKNPIGNFSVYSEKFYLDRDKDIVNSVDFMIATPRGFKEELRSGTWTTIRYARKKKKETLIVFPNGTYQIENEF